jgi:hypothetical protein
VPVVVFRSGTAPARIAVTLPLFIWYEPRLVSRDAPVPTMLPPPSIVTVATLPERKKQPTRLRLRGAPEPARHSMKRCPRFRRQLQCVFVTGIEITLDGFSVGIEVDRESLRAKPEMLTAHAMVLVGRLPEVDYRQRKAIPSSDHE